MVVGNEGVVVWWSVGWVGDFVFLSVGVLCQSSGSKYLSLDSKKSWLRDPTVKHFSIFVLRHVAVDIDTWASSRVRSECEFDV